MRSYRLFALFLLGKVGLSSARALHFVKARYLGYEQAAVPEFSGLLALGSGCYDRPEERGPSEGNDGRTHVLSYEVDAAAVAFPQLGIKFVGVVVLHEVCRQAHLFECFLHNVFVRLGLAAPLGVVARPDRVIELLDIFAAVEFLCGNNYAHRAPRLVHRRAVVSGEIAALVQHGKGHHVPVDFDVTDLGDFFYPAGSHPSPGALWVEPKICSRLCHALMISNLWRRSKAATIRGLKPAQ